MTLFGISLPLLAGVGLAFLIAGFVKGVVGFTLPLVGISLLSLLLPIEVALAVMTLPLLASNLVQAITAGNLGANLRTYWPLILALAVGLFVGANFAAAIDGQRLFLFLGAVVLIFSLHGLFGRGINLPQPPPVWLGPAFGFAGGVIGGISTVFGTLVAIYLTALKLPREVFVGAIGLIFFCGGVFLLLAYAQVDFLTVRLAWASAAAVVPTWIGMELGARLRRRLDAERFRRLVFIALLVLSVNLLRRGLGVVF